MQTNPFERILQMNAIFGITTPDEPTDHGKDRLQKFYKITREEMNELPDCYEDDAIGGGTNLVSMADYCADQIYYHISEALRWGIDIERVLQAVIDSQETKLVDGKAIWNSDGSKYLKGPNFVAPENAIAEILFPKTPNVARTDSEL